MSYFTHSFEAEVTHHFVGTYLYTVVYLPDDLTHELPLKQHPRLRVSAEIADIPVEAAWQPASGRWYMMLSRKVLRSAGVTVGDRVDVRFSVVDQDAVDVPDDLWTAVAANEDAREAWEALSAGKQRGLAHSVASAKRAQTRTARIATVVDRLLHADHYSRTGKWIGPPSE